MESQPTKPNSTTANSTSGSKQKWKKRGKYPKRAPDGWHALKGNTDLIQSGDQVWDVIKHKFINAGKYDFGEYASEYHYVIRKDGVGRNLLQ